MIPNKDLTQEEAQWMIENFTPAVQNGRISGDTMEKYFVKVRSLIMGKPVGRPGCGCHYQAYVAMTKSLFGQHYAEIEAIANPPKKVTKRGRKPKGEA